MPVAANPNRRDFHVYVLTAAGRAFYFGVGRDERASARVRWLESQISREARALRGKWVRDTSSATKFLGDHIKCIDSDLIEQTVSGACLRTFSRVAAARCGGQRAAAPGRDSWKMRSKFPPMILPTDVASRPRSARSCMAARLSGAHPEQPGITVSGSCPPGRP